METVKDISYSEIYRNILQKTAKYITSVGARWQLFENLIRAKIYRVTTGNKGSGNESNILELTFNPTNNYFVNLVGPEKEMDYKSKRPWWGLTDTFYFMGEEITYEDFGNINYGYFGSALGYGDTVLYTAGGALAVALNLMGKKADIGSKEYFYDSEEDYNNVKIGIDLYYRDR